MKSIRDDKGATLVEFALVALPVIFFILGIIQTAYIIWVDNLLHTAVNTAARCGAIGSNTAPCAGTNLVTTANTCLLYTSDAADE